MTLFGAIFEVNNRVGKLWYLLGHFDKKGTIDFNKYPFFIEQYSITLYVHATIV